MFVVTCVAVVCSSQTGQLDPRDLGGWQQHTTGVIYSIAQGILILESNISILLV